MITATSLPILAAGAYLCTLGIASFICPANVVNFMGEFAGTLRAHLLELALRIILGVSLIHSAPGMYAPTGFRAFGWVLVATSVLLLMLPWRWHRRFARWSVPQATANLPLLGAASVVGGAFVLWALLEGGA